MALPVSAIAGFGIVADIPATGSEKALPEKLNSGLDMAAFIFTIGSKSVAEPAKSKVGLGMVASRFPVTPDGESFIVNIIPLKYVNETTPLASMLTVPELSA